MDFELQNTILLTYSINLFIANTKLQKTLNSENKQILDFVASKKVWMQSSIKNKDR